MMMRGARQGSAWQGRVGSMGQRNSKGSSQEELAGSGASTRGQRGGGVAGIFSGGEIPHPGS